MNIEEKSMNSTIREKEAIAYGINMDTVGVCKQLRKLAKLDRIQLDESVHRNGLNKHLFSYIEYCMVDVKDYIKSYLSNIQPYMIERFSSEETQRNYICVLDKAYRISIYIKVDKTFGQEIIVSFHENHRRGIAKENNMITNKTPGDLVPVFAEEICSRIEGAAKEEIKVLIQRGMMLIPIRIMGQRCDNGTYIVNRQDIEAPILEQCNQYLRDLYTSNLDLEALDKVEIFSFLHQISFTSYGNTVFSNLTLLIDNMAIQKSVIGKKAADFALTTYVEHLTLNEDQAKELIDLIDEKYRVSSQKGIDIISSRIKDVLACSTYCDTISEDIVPTDTTSNDKGITILSKRPGGR